MGNVDNTTDLNKPISTATQAALDTKYSSTIIRLPMEHLATSGGFAVRGSYRGWRYQLANAGATVGLATLFGKYC